MAPALFPLTRIDVVSPLVALAAGLTVPCRLPPFLGRVTRGEHDVNSHYS